MLHIPQKALRSFGQPAFKGDGLEVSCSVNLLTEGTLTFILRHVFYACKEKQGEWW
jgi:hypothetical protein